jgi:hypothetical protein
LRPSWHSPSPSPDSFREVYFLKLKGISFESWSHCPIRRILQGNTSKTCLGKVDNVVSAASARRMVRARLRARRPRAAGAAMDRSDRRRSCPWE